MSLTADEQQVASNITSGPASNAPATSIGFGDALAGLRGLVTMFSADNQTNMLTLGHDINNGALVSSMATLFNQFDPELSDMRDALANGDVDPTSPQAQNFLGSFGNFFQELSNMIGPFAEQLGLEAEFYEGDIPNPTELMTEAEVRLEEVRLSTAESIAKQQAEAALIAEQNMKQQVNNQMAMNPTMAPTHKMS